MAAIEVDYLALDESMRKLEKLFPKGKYLLTLIARYVGTESLDADVVLTRDDLEKTMESLKKMAARDPKYKIGDQIPLVDS